MKKNSSMLNLVWSMLLEYRALAKHLFWLIPGTTIIALAQIAEPYIYKLLFDFLLSKEFLEGNFHDLTWKISLWIGCVVISLIFGYIMHNAFYNRMQQYWSFIVGKGIASFVSRPYSYHIAVNNAEKIKIFHRGIDAAYESVTEIIRGVFKSSLLLIGYITLAFLTNIQLTLLLLIIIGILSIFPMKLSSKVHFAQKKVNNFWDQVYSRAGDSLVNVLIVKLFSRREFDVREIQSHVLNASKAQGVVTRYWAMLDAGQQTINLFISIVVMGVSFYFYSKGLITPGDIVLFIAVSGKVTGPFLSLESSYRNIVKNAADFAKYQEVLESPSEKDSGTMVCPKMKESIAMKNVSFIYEGTNREVLRGVNLEFKKGQKTALVGHTGSGKSTISNLLVRFYEPTNGEISLDGKNINEFTLDSYRSQFAMVFQDTTLFNSSLRYNLSYVRDGITEDEIIQACRDANIYDFITSLPEGLDTIVGERGLKLSGGEKQRIAIARAMLANPEILILDEATSSLDAKTEKLVTEALNILMKGRTSIIIAHRLSTIQHADNIYLLEQGGVIGQGQHKELYKSSKIYQEMVDFQKDGFVE